MKKKPIPPNKGMFADGLAFQILFEGILIGSLALGAFVIGHRFFDTPALNRSLSEQLGTEALPGVYIPWVGRTMAFAVLSLSQLFHSFNMRSSHSLSKIGLFTNRKLVYSFLICAFLQISVITIPALAAIFQVIPLTVRQWAIVLLLSVAPILVVEVQKAINSIHEGPIDTPQKL